jgi:hypothetical protein
VAAASELLKPYDARLMRATRISTRINHVANDDPECSAPVELAEVRKSSLFIVEREAVNDKDEAWLKRRSPRRGIMSALPATRPQSRANTGADSCSLYDNHQSAYAEHEWSPKFR